MSMLFQLPSLDSLLALAPDEQMKKIKSYLFQLTEQLKYVLSNIDEENLVPALAARVGGTAQEAQVEAALDETRQMTRKRFDEALARMIAMADAMSAEYSSELNVLEDRIQSEVAASYELQNDLNRSVLEVQSQITQSASDLTAVFTRMGRLEEAVGAFRDEAFSTYIRFDGDGILLGESGSDFRCRLSNTRLAFLQGSSEIASVANNRLNITDASVTGTLSLGDGNSCYDIRRETNGSISLVWRG